MARYEHLPIYRQALDVAVHFDKVVVGKEEVESNFAVQSRGGCLQGLFLAGICLWLRIGGRCQKTLQ